MLARKHVSRDRCGGGLLKDRLKLQIISDNFKKEGADALPKQTKTQKVEAIPSEVGGCSDMFPLNIALKTRIPQTKHASLFSAQKQSRGNEINKRHKRRQSCFVRQRATASL